MLLGRSSLRPCRLAQADRGVDGHWTGQRALLSPGSPVPPPMLCTLRGRSPCPCTGGARRFNRGCGSTSSALTGAGIGPSLGVEGPLGLRGDRADVPGASPPHGHCPPGACVVAHGDGRWHRGHRPHRGRTHPGQAPPGCGAQRPRCRAHRSRPHTPNGQPCSEACHTEGSPLLTLRR